MGGGNEFLGKIDNFRILRRLGAGGFGVVYLAEDEYGAKFAIKGMHPSLKSNTVELDKFGRNFAMVANLQHPNIAGARVILKPRDIQYYDEHFKSDFAINPGDPILVMTYAAGETLKEYRHRFEGKCVPVEQALEICMFVARALDYANSLGIVHRDVKPSNIMVKAMKSGKIIEVKVLDFGLAIKKVPRVMENSNSTRIVGTMPYMSPEQWRGEDVSGECDQYALAVVLYELLTGKVPFAEVFASHDMLAITKVVRDGTPNFVRGIRASQNMVLRKALSKDPNNRYGSAEEMISAFKNAKSFDIPASLTIFFATVRAKLLLWESEIQKKLLSVRLFLSGNHYKPSQEIISVAGVRLSFVNIRPCKFMMGSSGNEIGRTPAERLHSVTLTKSYKICTILVTQLLWQKIMGENPAYFKSGGTYPVESISHDDCIMFLTKLNRDYPIAGYQWMLPTDAQWECAARAGKRTPYGNDGDIDEFAWYKDNSDGKTHPVAEKAPNGFGIYDMHGLVWEWCRDGWIERLPLAAKQDPFEGPQKSGEFVCRGGSWNNGASSLRSATRRGMNGKLKFDNIGFRLVLEKSI